MKTIDEVILVHDLHAPCFVLETVKSSSGRKLSKGVKLDETVTIGASILGGVLVSF
jgi:molecular chaperone DnaK (HSP70)